MQVMASVERFVMRVRCGKGTYIRVLAADMARALGTVGHLSALVRTDIGPYGREEAITLDKLDQWSFDIPG